MSSGNSGISGNRRSNSFEKMFLTPGSLLIYFLFERIVIINPKNRVFTLIFQLFHQDRCEKILLAEENYRPLTIPEFWQQKLLMEKNTFLYR